MPPRPSWNCGWLTFCRASSRQVWSGAAAPGQHWGGLPLLCRGEGEGLAHPQGKVWAGRDPQPPRTAWYVPAIGLTHRANWLRSPLLSRGASCGSRFGLEAWAEACACFLLGDYQSAVYWMRPLLRRVTANTRRPGTRRLWRRRRRTRKNWNGASRSTRSKPRSGSHTAPRRR